MIAAAAAPSSADPVLPAFPAVPASQGLVHHEEPDAGPAALNVALSRFVRYAHDPIGSSVAHTCPMSTKSGVPGGCGMPRIFVAAMNSPASQNVTVGARLAI